MDQCKKKIILICSGGGHLAEILQLEEMFVKYDYILITEKTPFTSFFNRLYNIRFIKSRPIGKKRSILFFTTLIVNFFLSVKLLFKHYPRVIISTGSETAVPMCFLGRLLGIKIVFILSFSRVSSGSKAADLIYPIADKFIVQCRMLRTTIEMRYFWEGYFNDTCFTWNLCNGF